MRLGRLIVSNFRAIKLAALDFEDVTVLLGENNAGKSGFLAALDLFFAASPRVLHTDYFAGKTDDPIAITVEFVDLTPAERELFESNLLEGRFIVTRTFHHDSGKDSGGFSVDKLANPDFTACRAEEGKQAKRELYAHIREQYLLPNVTRAEDIEPALSQWEAENVGSLTRERVGGFRGFKNVASGQLKKNTDFVLVPAVKDAGAEIGQAKASPVKQIIDAVARQTIQNSAPFKAFVAEASEKLRDLTSPDAVPGLAQINDNLTAILSRYYRESKISATWMPLNDLPIQMPAAEIAVSDHGFTTTIEGVGHGLQRAIILTVLQYLAEQEAAIPSDATFEEAQSDIIIAIEEPELYQHPTKQRLFKQVFRELVSSFNEANGIRIQIVYSTHSALLFEFPDFAKLRLIRRVQSGDTPAVTVRRSTLSECAQALAKSVGKNPEQAFTDGAMLARLHVFDAEIAEGFFGRTVVLIEGPSDRAIIDAYYRTLGRDPLAEGIVFAPLEGKSKLERPAVIFGNLGIPTYMVFDSDKKHQATDVAHKKVALNRQLQRICGVDEGELQDWPNDVAERFCSWEDNIEVYLQECAGHDEFFKAVDAAKIEFAINRDSCFKTPVVASSCIVKWKSKKIQFPKLDQLVARIDTLLKGAA